MGSNAKRRQTLDKRRREQAVKERRAIKDEKRAAKKLAAAEPPAGEEASADGPYAALLARLDLSAGEAELLSDEEIVARAVDAGILRPTAERMLALGRGSGDPARGRPDAA